MRCRPKGGETLLFMLVVIITIHVLVHVVGVTGLTTTTVTSSSSSRRKRRHHHSTAIISAMVPTTTTTSMTATTASTKQSTVPTATTTSRSATATTAASATSHTFYTMVDGTSWEWLSESPLMTTTVVDGKASSSSYSSTSTSGCLAVVVGTLESTREEVIGMLATVTNDKKMDDSIGEDKMTNKNAAVLALTTGQYVWKESVARLDRAKAGISSSAAAKGAATVSPETMAVTYVTALTHLYPCLAMTAPSVGGSHETYSGVSSVPQGPVVILGGNPEAVWAANAMVTLFGSSTESSNGQKNSGKVTLVTSVKNSPSLSKEVTVLNCNTPFATSVGQFHVLLDTVGREGSQSRTVNLLARRHGCTVYRSTRTQAEQILATEGLLWGPGKAKEYIKSLLQSSAITPTTSPRASSTLPVAGWGALVEQLYRAQLWAPMGALQPSTVSGKDNSEKSIGNKHTVWARGWSLKAAWEANSWPSNTDGTRYGFPTLMDDDDDEVDGDDDKERNDEDEDDDDDDDDDDNDDDFVLINKENLPSRVQPRSAQAQQAQEAKRVGTRSRIQPSSASPYVLTVYGTEGLEKDIVQAELDCILFMSAPFCRTCRKLQAPYARLARLSNQDETSNVVYAKADIIGSFGKALGQSLGVNAVPTFVLFRKGERFGKPLNISRLPHPQLDLALQYLKERRQDWDDKDFEAEADQPQTRI